MLRTVAYAAAIAAALPAPASAQGTASWYFQINTDPITDREIGVATLLPTTNTSRRGEARLNVRCKDNSTDVWIEWGNFINTDVTHPVTVRIGKQLAQTVAMNTSTDHTATFVGNPVPFLKSLVGQDTVAFRTEPYSESPVTVVFGVSGLETPLAPLAKMCGWSFTGAAAATPSAASRAAPSPPAPRVGTACAMQMRPDDPRIQGALEVEGGAVYRVTANTTLNMRQLPSATSEIIAELCRDELVVGLERAGEWMLIVAPARGMMGYAAAKWLRVGD